MVSISWDIRVNDIKDGSRVSYSQMFKLQGLGLEISSCSEFLQKKSV